MKNKFLYLILILLTSESIFASYPYKFDDNTKATVATVASAAALTYSLTNTDLKPLTENEISKLMEKKLFSFNQISVDNYNNDISLISDIMLGICMAIPAAQIFDGRASEEWGIYGLMYIENVAFAGGAAAITKNIFRAPRPYVYSKDAPMEMKQEVDARLSFFSGHSALAFAGMTFFAETYGDLYPETKNHTLIWLGSMTLASTTAILRIFSGRHFPVDVLVGAAVGIAIGKLIPELHDNKDPITNQPVFRINKLASINLSL
jgi:membrane-associated phospholipid phosphatase